MADEQAGSAYEGAGLLDSGSHQAQEAPDAKLPQRIHTEDAVASQQMGTAFLDALPPDKKLQFLQVVAVAFSCSGRD